MGKQGDLACELTETALGKQFKCYSSTLFKKKREI